VTLTARDVSDALRLLRRLVGDAPKAAAFDVVRERPRPIEGRERHDLIVKARQLLRQRRRRERILPRAMFGEPAWDMLLHLYLNDRRYTIAALTEACNVTPSTALRWIEYLVGDGLVERTPHPTDARAQHIALSQKGRSALDVYFSEVIADG